MVARIARFEGVDVAEARRTSAEVAGIMRPLVEGLPGYEGMAAYLSEGGEMLVIHEFDSEENAVAAEDTFDRVMPEKLGHLFATWKGHRVSAGLFERIQE